MNSMKDFIKMLFQLVLAGIVYMFGCMKLFKWWDRRKKNG